MKLIFLYIIILFSFLFSHVVQDSTQIIQEDPYHISLIVHEELINDFFRNMGKIEGKGETGLMSYRWKLIDPKIDIEEDTILFISKIRLSVGDFKTHKNVEGWVSATFDQAINKIKLKIEEAKVILDIDLFGKNIVLTESDIAHYFTDAFNLNGPAPMSELVEFNLPNGETRQINVQTNQSYLSIIKDAILVKTTLGFNQ